MWNIEEGAEAWRADLSERFGAAVREARKERHMTVAQVSDKTQALGFLIRRVALTKIETNKRGGRVEFAEVIILSIALGVSPMQLLFPRLPDGRTRLWPAAWDLHRDVELMLWFSGEVPIQDLPGTLNLPPADTRRVELAREIQRSRAEVQHLERISLSTSSAKTGVMPKQMEWQIARAAKELKSRIREALGRGWPVNDDMPKD